MKLPSDYLEVVRRGATTLGTLGGRLRDVAARKPQLPELWLSVRDFEGLAGRLRDLDDEEWRRGFANVMISPQDFGVLDELIARGGADVAPCSREEAATLTRLREFLRQYFDRKFVIDEPAT